VVGDTVGDPFKDTSSVALNPIIKFTTLFGLLAVELAIGMTQPWWRMGWAALLFGLAVINLRNGPTSHRGDRCRRARMAPSGKVRKRQSSTNAIYKLHDADRPFRTLQPAASPVK
jgi:hypothetical protein